MTTCQIFASYFYFFSPSLLLPISLHYLLGVETKIAVHMSLTSLITSKLANEYLQSCPSLNVIFFFLINNI